MINYLSNLIDKRVGQLGIPATGCEFGVEKSHWLGMYTMQEVSRRSPSDAAHNQESSVKEDLCGCNCLPEHCGGKGSPLGCQKFSCDFSPNHCLAGTTSSITTQMDSPQAKGVTGSARQVFERAHQESYASEASPNAHGNHMLEFLRVSRSPKSTPPRMGPVMVNTRRAHRGSGDGSDISPFRGSHLPSDSRSPRRKRSPFRREPSTSSIIEGIFMQRFGNQTANAAFSGSKISAVPSENGSGREFCSLLPRKCRHWLPGP